MKTSIAFLVSLALGVAGLGCQGPPAHAQTAKQSTGAPRYVGSTQCAGCHKSEHAEWLGSHHATSMQHASDKSVLGRFDGAKLTEGNVETTFFKQNGRFLVRTDGPDGKLADFEVKFTFGVTPLQQYLIELPGGRLQAFGIAWDARPAGDGGQRWYHLYPGQGLTAGRPLHWTGLDQNWNYQCASCHSTNLEKNYDRATRTFSTKWSEISVGCEACHGPASKHVAWGAQSAAIKARDSSKGFDLRFHERRGITWAPGNTGEVARSMPRQTSKELLACAACHARREQFSGNVSSARGFFEAFRASTLESPIYHVDGQQRDEVFNYGSFLQSRMHVAGVTCSDCHNPHTGKLRYSGNAVCLQCHTSERFDSPRHHHHAAGSTGAQCTSCHMSTTVYMGIDARHDHSFRLPRPDRSHALATPNACDRCHGDKSAQWATDAIKSWYPSPKAGAQTFAEAFDLGDRGAPGAQSALIQVADDGSLSGLVRASAVVRLARYPSPRVLAAIARALQVDDPDMRAAAIASLSGAESSTRRSLLVPLLSDPIRLVRMDAARQLAGEIEQFFTPEERRHFERGIAEYEAAQLFNAERPETLVNLGMLYQQRGMSDKARAAFSEAMHLDRTFYPAAVSLAELERSGGDEAAAESVLRTSLDQNPNSGPLLHALGLSLVRQMRGTEALERLAGAVRATPENPNFAYVYAVALNEQGRKAEAIATLKSALIRHPYDRDVLRGLVSYEADSRDFASALARAELLVRLEPERTDIQRLVGQLRQRTR